MRSVMWTVVAGVTASMKFFVCPFVIFGLSTEMQLANQDKAPLKRGFH